VPSHVVLGGGVNGLTVARRLAERGADVVVLEKDRPGAGASGIAGGIVRNFYRSEAITELVRRSVEIFESEPDAYGFRQVGYLAAVPERQVSDLVAIREAHERAGYASELVIGAEPCHEYLTWTWPDWEAPVAALLHERRAGWADAMSTVRHLADRARAAGAEIREGVEVTGFDGGVETTEGRIACETVIVAPGPWIARVWRMLGLDPEIDVAGEPRPLVSFMQAQEGEFQLSGAGLGGTGAEPPVVHLDQSEPLRSDRDGRVLVDGPWGIYFRGSSSIAGGGLPAFPADPVLDPYGWENPSHVAGEEFQEFLTSGLAVALRRFRGRSGDWRMTANGGIIPHTPDNYPVCDWVREDVYAIVDSGHGFKTLALGALVADDILDGGEPILDAFRLRRFAAGATHAASQGPYPWT
jgi:glycine/D-amino acid oxidase-like deaminating enzyme